MSAAAAILVTALFPGADGALARPSGANDIYGGEPAWSPDGTRIVFTHVTPNYFNEVLWTAAADGSAAAPLTADLPGHQHSPSWARDGSRIAFSQHDA